MLKKTFVKFAAGEVTRDNSRYSGAISLRSAGVEVEVNGKLVKNPSQFSCKAQAIYRVGTGSAQSIELSTKLNSNFKNRLIKRHLAFNLQVNVLLSTFCVLICLLVFYKSKPTMFAIMFLDYYKLKRRTIVGDSTFEQCRSIFIN